MKLTTLVKALAAAQIAVSLNCLAADGILLPGKPVLLPPTVVPGPTSGSKLPLKNSTTLSGAIAVLADLGPKFNKTVVYSVLEKRYSERLNAGWAEAVKQGQRGVLMKVEVLQQTTDAGEFLALRGDGAYYVGTGPDADAVCFALKCGTELEPVIQPGQKLTSESAYIWTELVDGKFKVSRFSIKDLEGRSFAIRASGPAAAAYTEVVRTAAVQSYAESLVAAANNRADKLKIEALLQNRADNLKKIGEVEAELKRELERAERAAATSAMVRGLAGAFSLVSAVAMANISAGEDLHAHSPTGEIKDMDGLMGAVANFVASTGAKVDGLVAKQRTFTDAQTGVTTEILQLGVSFNRPPPGDGTVLNPKP